MSKSIGLTQVAQYEIRVKGVLDPRWQSWFEGMTITAGDDETIATVVTLAAENRDGRAAQRPVAVLNEIGGSCSSPFHQD